MDLTRYENLRLALQLAGIKPKKGLGQHFLVDRDSVERIIAAAEVGPEDTVLEIGPGLGVMTYALCQQAKKVVAVEQDSQLAELLRRDQPANLQVVEGDILEFDLSQLPTKYKVVANLPYFITSKILRLLMESANPPVEISVLVQKEVAERITAAPGSLSILALSVQYYAEAQLAGLVERFKFWPPPEVDSAILRLRRRAEPLFEADRQKLFRLIKAGFGEKRKQLKNSLAGGLNVDAAVITELLNQAGISPMARAQELNFDQWEQLYHLAERRQLV